MFHFLDDCLGFCLREFSLVLPRPPCCVVPWSLTICFSRPSVPETVSWLYPWVGMISLIISLARPCLRKLSILKLRTSWISDARLQPSDLRHLLRALGRNLDIVLLRVLPAVPVRTPASPPRLLSMARASPPDMRGPLSPGGRDLRGASDSNQVFIPPPSGPVGGRLLDFSLQWCHITSDSWVLQTVSLGYQLEFTSTPPSHPPQRVTPVPADPARRSALEKEILSLREKKAISVLPPGSASRFTSTFFLASKKTGDWWPIINLRPLNFYIKPKHFRMESLSTVLQSLPTGWWATSIDLKDAYLHVPIHIGHREFLQFIYRGTTYQFGCLPFGLSTAPGSSQGSPR